MIVLILALLAGLAQHVVCITTSLEYSQPIPSNNCGGCQVSVQYDYSVPTDPKNPKRGALYIAVLQYVAKGVKEQNGHCVTDFGFPVNMGTRETLTISTKVATAQVSSVASKAVSQVLGTSLCITTPYTTIAKETPTPEPASTSSTSAVFHTVPASDTPVVAATILLSGTAPLATSSIQLTNSTSSTSANSASASQTRLITTVTRADPTTTNSSPQPALAPSKTPSPNDQKLKIIAGVVTSVLGILALALAFLLWRRYRRHRRGSSASTVGSFFFSPRPREEQHANQAQAQVSRSLAKASVSTAPMSMRKDAHELAGETGSMDVRWRETYYEERETIPVPQELKGGEPPRYEMDTRGRSRMGSVISPMTP